MGKVMSVPARTKQLQQLLLPGASVRPCFSFEIHGEITPAIQQEFDRQIFARLCVLNADFREATREYEGSASRLIRLFRVGTGPFSGDAACIKQTRVLKTPPRC